MKSKIIQRFSKHFIMTIVICVMMLPIEIKANDSYNDVLYYTPVDHYLKKEIVPYAEATGYIYKILNGRQYKRLWSYTYNRWIDPNWVLA